MVGTDKLAVGADKPAVGPDIENGSSECINLQFLSNLYIYRENTR